MSVEPKRILILTAAVGNGHESAARAVKCALEEQVGPDCQVDVCNPFDEPVVPAIVRNAQSDHTDLVREFPHFYALGLRFTDSDLLKGIGNLAGLVALRDAMPNIMARYQPDVVAATHPLHLEPLLSWIDETGARIRTATIVTDLTQVHRLWYNPGVDLCLVPTEEARILAIQRNMPPERVVVTGLPVDPAFGHGDVDKDARLRDLNLSPDRATIIAVGSRRVLDLEQYVTELNDASLPVQLILVAGGDSDLYHALQAIDWQIPVALFDYVDELPQLMKLAEAIVSKAGGLIVAESLAVGLPLLIVPSTPRHEAGNAAYVVSNGAGYCVDEPAMLRHTVKQWLANDRVVWKERTANALRIGQPDAAYATARHLWRLAETAPVAHRARRAR